MSRTLIVGGGGMVGQKLAATLMSTNQSHESVSHIDLFDLSYPDNGIDSVASQMTGNLVDADTLSQLASARYEVIIHLAAIVSGDAEKNFDLGWQVNLFSLWELLRCLKSEHETSNELYRPRLVFASTTGTYGPPFEGPVSDRHICEPQSSYGAQKVCAEMLISDFSRKGYIDGIALRLPTICVRPGKPNKAASSFFSNIIREPLNGRSAVLPVTRDLHHMFASPKSAAQFFVHASQLDTELLNGRRALNMPSVTCSIGDQINALRKIAGDEVVKLIEEVPDPFVHDIVSTWPTGFEATRARELGFKSESSFEEILQVYIEDDLPQDQNDTLRRKTNP